VTELNLRIINDQMAQKQIFPLKYQMSTCQRFSTNLVNVLGSGRYMLNNFKFDWSTNLIPHDLFFSTS